MTRFPSPPRGSPARVVLRFEEQRGRPASVTLNASGGYATFAPHPDEPAPPFPCRRRAGRAGPAVRRSGGVARTEEPSVAADRNGQGRTATLAGGRCKTEVRLPAWTSAPIPGRRQALEETVAAHRQFMAGNLLPADLRAWFVANGWMSRRKFIGAALSGRTDEPEGRRQNPFRHLGRRRERLRRAPASGLRHRAGL